MTVTYDPHHPKYLDESDVRDELTRVYDLCHGCRLCFKFCSSFPTLFEYIDRHEDQDAAKLTKAYQEENIEKRRAALVRDEAQARSSIEEQEARIRQAEQRLRDHGAVQDDDGRWHLNGTVIDV